MNIHIIGIGNLAIRFVPHECRVCGVIYSPGLPYPKGLTCTDTNNLPNEGDMRVCLNPQCTGDLAVWQDGAWVSLDTPRKMRRYATEGLR